MLSLSGGRDNQRAREPPATCEMVRSHSAAGVLPRAKIKTIKMTLVIVIGIFALQFNSACPTQDNNYTLP